MKKDLYPRLTYINQRSHPGGKSRLGLGIGAEAATGISFFDFHGIDRLDLTLSPDGSNGLSLRNSKGRSLLTLGASPDDEALINLNDRDGRSRLQQSVDRDGMPSFIINNDKNVGIFEVPK